MPRTVQAIGWDWTPQGVVVTLVVDGALLQWLVPIAHVHATFSSEMQRVGAPFPYSVGAPSVGGIFGSISKAYKKATRKIKKAIPKAVKRATNRVTKLAASAAKQASRRAKSYARDVSRAAKRTVRDPRQLGLALATGGASTMAQTKIQRDVLGLAKNIPGPIGTAATVARTGGAQLANVAQGKRVDFGKLATGLAEAGVNYIPGGAALTSTPLGRTAFHTGLGVAKGQRIDRALKRAVLREANLPGLVKSLPLPGSAALNEAHRAWGVINRAHSASRALKRGLPFDRRALTHGARGLQALRRTVRQAQAGNRRARELVSAIHRVGACI